MQGAENAYAGAVDKDFGGVFWMLPSVNGSNLFIFRLFLLDFTYNAVDYFNRLEIERLFVSALIIKNNAQTLSLVAATVFISSVNNSAVLEYSEFFGKILVFLNHRKEGGKHRISQNAVFGILDIENLDIILNLNAELLEFSAVTPDVGMNLVHTESFNKDILDFRFFKPCVIVGNGL